MPSKRRSALYALLMSSRDFFWRAPKMENLKGIVSAKYIAIKTLQTTTGASGDQFFSMLDTVCRAACTARTEILSI
jgi:hypothetical protein